MARSTVYRVAERLRKWEEAGLLDGREDNGQAKLDERSPATLYRLVKSNPQVHGWEAAARSLGAMRRARGNGGTVAEHRAQEEDDTGYDAHRDLSVRSLWGGVIGGRASIGEARKSCCSNEDWVFGRHTTAAASVIRDMAYLLM